MPRHLKAGRTPEQSSVDAKKVRDIVTGILEEIQSHGEVALREISERLDKWNPPVFRLSEGDIEAALSELELQSVEDIKFAQAQVRNFAREQRAALSDVEVETLPGVILGHKNIPVDTEG